MTLNRHQVTSNTVGLWQFDGSLVDSSTNGYDLSLDTGTERYSQLWPGMTGFLFDGNSSLIRSAATPNLQITGDMTIEFFYFSIRIFPPTATEVLTYFGIGGETAPTNYLYQISFETNTSIQWFSEHGAGANDLYQFTGQHFPPRSMVHFAVTRRSNVIRLYYNGRLRGTSTTLTAPEDGSSGRIHFGGGNTIGIVSSFKILNVGLTDEEIAEEYNYTFGPVFGTI